MGLFDGPNQESSNGRGGGGSSRLIIALIIAAIAFFTYLNKSEQNPITGQKQYVSMTPEQEIKLGLQSVPEMAAQMGGEIPASDPRAQEVKKIGQEIVQNSQAHKGPWRFQFHLLADTKTINAFALPGGQIFITLALLNDLQTEAQLAGVLAHEVGHVIQRHAAVQMAKGQLGQMLVVATGIGASDSSGGGSQMAAIASMVNKMTQLRYGRQDELEADEWGLRLMTEAGYNPKAMLQVMSILEKASPGGGQPEMMLTHPYPESRIRQINAYLEKYPPAANLTEGRSLDSVFSRRSSFF
jgi:beta-barrel assembly-enhancing protease